MEEENSIDNGSAFESTDVIESSEAKLVESDETENTVGNETRLSANEPSPGEYGDGINIVQNNAETSGLGKHSDIDVIRCLPAQYIAGHSKEQAMNRPLFICGQAATILIGVALAA